MGIERIQHSTTGEPIHAGGTSPCMGTIKLKPWIPMGADATTVVQLGECDKCGKAFCDPGDVEVSDADLEAGRPA